MTGTFVHVIRHAEAGDRERWAGPDELRPLSDGGHHQAARLVQLYTDRPLRQLVSSPFLRCVQTLEPLAEARGLPIALREELAEGMPWGHLEKLVLEAEGEGSTAVCVHGDAFRALVSDLWERGIARRVNRSFRKGATWVLEVRDGTVVSARYEPAPPAS